ncbi:transposase [Sorangium sp. So ce448]|uniref:transposase n=1 Tax=Sorangium sp. So ce448 TaxID=3133314 RepID=UPI003F616CDF
MREYSESFKRKIIQRLLAPGGPTAVALSAETGVHQTTLSRWLRDARRGSAHAPWPAGELRPVARTAAPARTTPRCTS